MEGEGQERGKAFFSMSCIHHRALPKTVPFKGKASTETRFEDEDSDVLYEIRHHVLSI